MVQQKTFLSPHGEGKAGGQAYQKSLVRIGIKVKMFGTERSILRSIASQQKLQQLSTAKPTKYLLLFE